MGWRPLPLVVMIVLLFPGAASGGTHFGLDDGRRVEMSKWRSASSPILAPPAICPGGSRLDAPVRVQVETMSCLINFARARSEISGVSISEMLTASATGKTGDLIRCNSFSHYACGRELTYWFEAVGYLSQPCWRYGENLAWGREGFGTARTIFLAWMRSAAHRSIILGNFIELGASLRVGTLGGVGNTRIWAVHFGAHGCAPPPTG
jgi:hypothetical protein